MKANSPASISRRQFAQRSALAASALALPTFVPSRVFGANERLNVAAIGAGGKGAVDIDGCSRENIVAMADVGCMMHMNGILTRDGHRCRAVHIAELLGDSEDPPL